ncbi:hypothetical protein MMC19_004400 [Ptychographa xylographoides]|nr:hypothetical protein [Ptychographa xylographoides]
MDGGLRDWMPDLPAWEGLPNHSKQIPSGVFYSDILDNMNSANPSEKVHCRCHCGGVQFEITRPNHKSKQLHSPWGDAYCEHAKGGGKNLEDIKWWVRAEDTKWAASVCACNACRQGSGYDIQPWAFVAKTNIQQIGGDPLQFTMGTLKRYVISEGHYREFCRTCGAVIFWHCDARPALIDVSVGLMESSSGARAEDWLEWNTDRVSFEQFAQNKALIQNLEIGLKKWGKRLEI